VEKKLFLLCLMLIFVALTPLKLVWGDTLVPDLSPPDPPTNPQWVTPSNWQDEQAWLESLIGGSVYYYGKDEDGKWNDGSWSEGAFSSGWTYAVLKYGVGKPGVLNPDHWAIIDDDNYLDFTVISEITGLPVGRLSHIAYFGNTVDPSIEPVPIATPEPTSMLLMGAGLMTWGVIHRRRRRERSKDKG